MKVTPEQVRKRTLGLLQKIGKEIGSSPTAEDRINTVKYAQHKQAMAVWGLFLSGAQSEAEKLSCESYVLVGEMYNKLYPAEAIKQ